MAASSLRHSLIIEGNIGAGKSTFVRMLQDRLIIDPIFEPHERWQDIGTGDNLLEKFYSDTARWAYTFQTYAFVTRVLEQEKSQQLCASGVQVLERSVYSDRYCFAQNCFEMGVMQPLEWKLYCDWFSWLVEGYTTRPTGFVYLQTDPNVCFARLKKRARYEEAAVPLDYLVRLHEKHERWLIHKDGVADYLKNVPVLTLSCDEDFEHNGQQFEQHVKALVDQFDLLYKKEEPYQRERTLSI